jgi:hypothetical protein
MTAWYRPRLMRAVAASFVVAACAAPPVASVPATSAPTPAALDSATPEPSSASAGPIYATTVIAGTGTIGRSGDGGPAVAASIEYPVGITGRDGTVLFAEATANRVRQVSPDGIITTVAGTTKPGWSGDGGPAMKASLSSPTDVAFDAQGDLYVVDQDNQRVRRIDPKGVISTVAGTGAMSHTGDGGPAAHAALDAPFGVVIDRAGDILVTEETDGALRRIRPDGVIDTIGDWQGTPSFGI